MNSAGWNLLIGLAALSAGIATKQGMDFQGFSAMPEPDMPIVALPFEGTAILGLQLDWDNGKITY